MKSLEKTVSKTLAKNSLKKEIRNITEKLINESLNMIDEENSSKSSMANQIASAMSRYNKDTKNPTGLNFLIAALVVLQMSNGQDVYMSIARKLLSMGT